MRYEGRVPKSLHDWCDAHPERVYEVAAGYGYCTDSGFAYDIALRNGWRSSDDLVHSIIEPTVARALAELRAAVPCDCDACRRGESYGGSMSAQSDEGGGANETNA